jgi:hypothetical protein
MEAVAPHFCPLINTFATSDLIPILRRSAIHSLSQLLAPFESGIEKVTVRSSTFEAKTLSRFNVRFIERQLPESFGQDVEAGIDMHQQRRRSSTLSVAGKAGHTSTLTSPTPNDSTSTLTSTITAASVLSPGPPSTPFLPPTSAQRDELFLDSVSSLVSQRVDSWLNEPNRRELSVALESNRNKALSDKSRGSSIEDEGWKGASIESLTPWYATMRDEVLKRREMVEYDTFGWPVASEFTLSYFTTSHHGHGANIAAFV